MNKLKGGLGRGLGALLPPPGMPRPTTMPARPLIPTAPVPDPMPAPVQASALHPDPEPEPAPIFSSSVKPVEPPPIEPTFDVAPKDMMILEVSPTQIVANPHQPRHYFAPEELADLQASIKEHGILQPLVVTDLGNGRYELIAGERRLRSAKAVGLPKVPVIVRKADDQQKLELALIENIQRAELNAVEEAKAYKSLIENFGLTQEETAERVGKSRSQVANTVRLLDLDDDMLDALVNAQITKSHARTLLAEPDRMARRKLYEQMLHGGMTVRAAEARAGNRSRPIGGKDPNIAAIEAELREKLGTKVTIEMTGGAGKLSIHFYSREDLKSLIERLS